MPELSTLLQQHVDQLSHQPPGGFPAVRAKARRRTQQRVGFATVAALTVAVVVVTGTGTFSNDKHAPAHPSPSVTLSTTAGPTPAPTPSAKAATLVQTHWRMTSITAFGKTQPVDDEQVYLYVEYSWRFLLREHCRNITGGVVTGQTLTFSTRTSGSIGTGTPGCADQPLAKQVAEVLRSPLNDREQGQQLTLVGATGAMTFVAEPETVSPAPLTSRIWALIAMQTPQGDRPLSTFEEVPDEGRWLVFGNSGFMGQTACDALQGVAVTSGHFLDLAGVSPVTLDNCSGSAKAVKPLVVAAYMQLVDDGRVTWTITGTTLQLRGTSTTLAFADQGPASALQPSAAPSS